MAGTSSSPRLLHLVEAVYAGGGLLAHALPFGDRAVPFSGVLGQNAFQRAEDHLLFVGRRFVIERRGVVLGLVTLVDQQRGVAAVVDDQLRALAAGKRKGHRRAPPVLGQRFALPREYRVRLRAAIAAAAWSCVEKMLHEHQRTSAPSSTSVSISTAVWMVMCSEPMTRTPFSGFCGSVLAAHGHQSGHFMLGNLDLLAAPFGQRHVGNLIGKSVVNIHSSMFLSYRIVRPYLPG